MSEEFIPRSEHEAVEKRMETEMKRLADEDNRQNKRIDRLEEGFDEIRGVVLSIERLATNMENMQKEQEKQGERLGKIESRDGEKWRQLLWYIGTAVVGAVLGYLLPKILIG